MTDSVKFLSYNSTLGNTLGKGYIIFNDITVANTYVID